MNSLVLPEPVSSFIHNVIEMYTRAAEKELNTTGVRETPEKNGILNAVWLICKWVFPVAALVYLWHEGAFSPEKIQLTPAVAENLFIAILFIVVATLAVSMRFHYLLRCLDVASTAGKQLRLNFPGLLVQQFVSEAAFDGMRIVSAKKMGGSNASVLTALMADRLLGLLSLTTMAAVGLAWFWAGSGWLYAAAFPFAVVAVLPCVFVAADILHEKEYSWFRRMPGSAFIASIGRSLRIFRHHVRLLGWLFCTSCLTHLCLFTALYFCGQMLEQAQPSLPEAIVGGAVSSFAGIPPLPMAGLGVGETAFGETVARMRGHSLAASYASVFFVNRILVIVVGAVSWLIAALIRNKQ